MAGRCEVSFENACPAAWQVTVTEIGARYVYQDARGAITGEWRATKAADLPGSASASLFSHDAGQCVQQVIAVARISVPGRPDAILTASDPGDAAHCKLRSGFVVGPKSPSAADAASIEAALAQIPLGLYTEREFRALMVSIAPRTLQPNK